MLAALKWLCVGLACGALTQPPGNAQGVGWTDAVCPLSGRTISEDFYTRVYIRDCPYTWRSDTESRMRVSGEPNEWVHFKASATCTPAEWFRRVAVGMESRDVCRHRGGHATRP